MCEALILQPRIYRDWVKDKDLISFRVVEKETDLHIRARVDLREEARQSILKYRRPLENYIRENPSFHSSLKPLPAIKDAPQMVVDMAQAAEKAGVGPMATVAGAIAQLVGEDLLKCSPEVIVENGGDIFLKISRRRLIGIYAGRSVLTGKIALQIEPEDTPLGICCSSGKVGHSLSFGRADAVIVLSPCATLADAAATAIGNLIKLGGDISKGIEFAKNLEGLGGVAIIEGDKIGIWGEVKICR